MKLLLGGALAASAALAACGGDDGNVVERKSTPRAGAAGAAGNAGGAGASGTNGLAGTAGTAGGAGIAGGAGSTAAGAAGAGAGGAAGGSAGSTSGAAGVGGDAGAAAGGTDAGGQGGAAGAGGVSGAGAGGDTSNGGNGGNGGKQVGVGGKVGFGGFAGISSGGSGGAAGAAVSPLTQACTAYATARCDKAKTCVADEPKRVYGPSGDADCIELTIAECEDRAKAPSSNVTPENVQACATATANATCPAFRSPAPLPACAPIAGQAANDTPCSFDETCASKYCKKTLTAGCGVCSAMPANGADCTVYACGRSGLVCKPTDKPTGPSRTCQSLSAGFAACDADDDCAPGSYCPAAPIGIRSCKPSGGLNASCNTQELGSCDAGLGLSCKPGTPFPQQTKCTANELASPGAACGPGIAGNKICGGASECIGGKCVPHTVEGMTCDPTAGPACLLGFQCVVGQFGVKSCVDRGKQTCP